MSKTIRVKIHPQPFADMAAGKLTANVRKNDRDYQVGDQVLLEEFNPDTKEYTGKMLGTLVTNVLTGYGLPEGYALVSFGRLYPTPDQRSFDAWWASQADIDEPAPSHRSLACAAYKAGLALGEYSPGLDRILGVLDALTDAEGQFTCIHPGSELDALQEVYNELKG